MTRLHQRIITVDALSEPELSPADKRLVYVGCMMLADDSGCLRWDARTIRGNLFPYGDMEQDRIAEIMAELEADAFAWPYTADDGRAYAFLPAFPIWQRSRTRQFAPEVPQPSGITFTPAESMTNKGSGRYEYPWTIAELNPSETSHPNDLVSSAPNPSSLKGGASGPRAGREQPASGPRLEEAIRELTCIASRQPSEQEQERLGGMLDFYGPQVVTSLSRITSASTGAENLTVADVLDRCEAMCQ